MVEGIFLAVHVVDGKNVRNWKRILRTVLVAPFLELYFVLADFRHFRLYDDTVSFDYQILCVGYTAGHARGKACYCFELSHFTKILCICSEKGLGKRNKYVPSAFRMRQK